jgi:hypothetical protein
MGWMDVPAREGSTTPVRFQETSKVVLIHALTDIDPCADRHWFVRGMVNRATRLEIALTEGEGC